ncbi:MAG: ATP-grasp domain-containing protein [Anaerolineae bacterium]|nr:ATP-grasp domain-containing protein [Anaerolineae bacterium]
MNIVFVSPHFPPNYYNFCVALRRAGGNVLAIADTPYDSLRYELRTAINEYFRVEEMSYDALLRGVAFLTYRHGKIDRLESHNEHWLETDARLRSDFNVPGIKADEVLDLKAKSRMKARYMAAGIPVARGRVVQTWDEAKAFVEEVGYPIVAKPDIGVGAAGTYRIDSDEQLSSFFATKPPIDYIAEEFIRGAIVSFDGLAGPAGAPVYCTSHVFSQGIMETVNEERDISYYSLRELPADLEDLGLRTLREFGVSERFFHLEFFRTEDGRLVALEVNMRPPGGLTMDMFNWAIDGDLYQAWANIALGKSSGGPWQRKYHVGYAGRRHSHSYRYGYDNIRHTFGRLLSHHELINSVFRTAIGDEGYVFRSPDLAELQAALEYALERE